MKGKLYKSWKDAPDQWDWEHFTAREFACKCGKHCAGEYYHLPEFLDALELLRIWMQKPIRINSGHRCRLHNAEVGGAPLSEHKYIAADISIKGHDPVKLAKLAVEAGFKGIGFGRTFLHVDMRLQFKNKAAFHYPGGKKVWTERFGIDPVVLYRRTGQLKKGLTEWTLGH